jgi:hypothetical protein
MTIQHIKQRPLPLDGVKIPGNTNNEALRRTGIGLRARSKNTGIIIAGGKWKVATLGDRMNITVSRNQGKSWRVEGYFSNLKSAFNWLVDQQVRDSDLTDLKTLVKKIDEIKQEINNMASAW